MGFRGKYKNKRDQNEGPIFAALRAYGLSVCPIDTPADALVGWGGRTYLIEVKGRSGRLTEAQRAFLADWKGHHVILRTVDEATAWAQTIRAE